MGTQARKYIIAILGVTLIAYALWTSLPERKSGPGAVKIYKIGIIVRGSGYAAAVEGYKKKMEEIGYRQGDNVIYDQRTATTKEELAVAVQELAAGGADLIHTYSTPATQAAYLGTKDLANPIPVVFGSMGDPLISGVVKDTRRPGTNVTGVASLSTQLTGRRLELLKRVKPGARRVAMPHTAPELGDVAADKSVVIAQETADKLDIKLLLFPVESSGDNQVAAKKITRDLADGIVVGGDSLVWSGLDAYIARALAEKLPLAAFDINQVARGALIGFGPDYRVSGEQSALISHKILRGKPPGVIPVEVPQKLILAVNLNTAKAIGLEVPQEILQEADIIIGSSN